MGLEQTRVPVIDPYGIAHCWFAGQSLSPSQASPDASQPNVVDGQPGDSVNVEQTPLGQAAFEVHFAVTQ
jgi:hypothetical protein